MLFMVEALLFFLYFLQIVLKKRNNFYCKFYWKIKWNNKTILLSKSLDSTEKKKKNSKWGWEDDEMKQQCYLKIFCDSNKVAFSCFKNGSKKDLPFNVVNKYHNFYFFSIFLENYCILPNFYVINYAMAWIIF